MMVVARKRRWLMAATVAALMTSRWAHATSMPMGMVPTASQSGRVGGITQGNGPVMTGRVNVYAIWYGSFPSWPQTESVVEYFIAHWGTSYSYETLHVYTGTNGRVDGELVLANKTVLSAYKGTSLVDSDIVAIVSDTIPNTFPADPNGIYIVFLGQGISLNSGGGYALCGPGSGGYCGYHNHATISNTDIKFGIVGSGNCSECWGFTRPRRMEICTRMRL